jgi:IS1 family transposase
MKLLHGIMKKRFQLTTDGHKPYLDAVDKHFFGTIDYSVNHKIYKSTKKDSKSQVKGEHQFNPQRCVASHKRIISGEPIRALITTSHIERQNGTIRAFIKRFARATGAFSKKYENHLHSLALQFMYYNFCRIPHYFFNINSSCDLSSNNRRNSDFNWFDNVMLWATKPMKMGFIKTTQNRVVFFFSWGVDFLCPSINLLLACYSNVKVYTPTYMCELKRLL